MDLVLDIVDTFVLDRVYSTLLPSNTTSTNIEYNQSIAQYIDLPPSEWAGKSLLARDNPFRQGITLFILTWLFGTLTYLTTSTLSYFFIFDKKSTTHPKFLTRQIPLEIQSALLAIPQMALLTVPFFLLELHGFSRLYSSTPPFPAYTYLQFPFFIAFTDFAIYWIHRYEHHPAVYKWLHKPHHRWIVPTPYASFAFHPLDGWAQSMPYHVFPLLFPLEKRVYLALFAFVTLWTVFIHDGEYATKSPIINGSACHTYHHLYFNYNYGQFTTLWDRLGGSYRQPDADLFNRETKMGRGQWEKQVREMEKMVEEVEGVDERVYTNRKKEQ
ncbi:sterol desaturase family protein [Aspergillus puulaauensis]|uniref:C-5 sterol desaturase n=1 Tax=Aspergillus puulaauensis TaxID=1220207 RepID=A0A7R7XF51_9EURO|nr:c-5 sterol desaturase [Aspergillus puulaauensis]BCS20266.1 c-5 sterol desaturase [Aspergillus puulaauensis]